MLLLYLILNLFLGFCQVLGSLGESIGRAVGLFLRLIRVFLWLFWLFRSRMIVGDFNNGLFRTIQMQVCLLLEGLVDRELPTRLQVDLVLKLFLRLGLDFHERIMILLQTVLVLVELVPVLVQLLLGALELSAHLLFLFLEVRMLLINGLSLLKGLPLLLLLSIR